MPPEETVTRGVIGWLGGGARAGPGRLPTHLTGAASDCDGVAGAATGAARWWLWGPPSDGSRSVLAPLGWPGQAAADTSALRYFPSTGGACILAMHSPVPQYSQSLNLFNGSVIATTFYERSC